MRTDLSAADQSLLDKLNVAVTAANEAEHNAEAAKTLFVSRSRVVGELLLEAKKRHPKVADFEAFLKRVNGLKLSRAYDLMRLAGGRTTDDQLRQETRKRVQKHRAKKKLPKPEPAPRSVTHPDVTETPKQIPPNRITQSPEISAEERLAQNAALDAEPEQTPLPEPELMPGGQSAYYRDKFINACRQYLSMVEDESHQASVIRAFTRATKNWQCVNKAKAA